jgi:hypothetical protein
LVFNFFIASFLNSFLSIYKISEDNMMDISILKQVFPEDQFIIKHDDRSRVSGHFYATYLFEKFVVNPDLFISVGVINTSYCLSSSSFGSISFTKIL